MAGTQQELLPGHWGALGAGAAPAQPRSAAFPSLPFPALRGGAARLPGREGAARSSEPFSLRFPLGLARTQGAPGSQRPTHGE